MAHEMVTPRSQVILNWKFLNIYERGFPGGSVVKNLPASAGDAGDVDLIPGSEKSPGGGNGHPLQYSCPENYTDRGVWRTTIQFYV